MATTKCCQEVLWVLQSKCWQARPIFKLIIGGRHLMIYGSTLMKSLLPTGWSRLLVWMVQVTTKHRIQMDCLTHMLTQFSVQLNWAMDKSLSKFAILGAQNIGTVIGATVTTSGQNNSKMKSTIAKKMMESGSWVPSTTRISLGWLMPIRTSGRSSKATKSSLI